MAHKLFIYYKLHFYYQDYNVYKKNQNFQRFVDQEGGAAAVFLRALKKFVKNGTLILKNIRFSFLTYFLVYVAGYWIVLLFSQVDPLTGKTEMWPHSYFFQVHY